MRPLFLFAVTCVAGVCLISGCAQHRLSVKNPNPTGETFTVSSSGFGWGTVQKVTATECNTDLIDKVIVHQNLGQALGSILTLGLWNRTTIEYECAKKPAPTVGSNN
ncbi:MAG: hypothetical protein ACKVOJ_10865 [Sphingomonadaceae bacterium]